MSQFGSTIAPDMYFSTEMINRTIMNLSEFDRKIYISLIILQNLPEVSDSCPDLAFSDYISLKIWIFMYKRHQIVHKANIYPVLLKRKQNKTLK